MMYIDEQKQLSPPTATSMFVLYLLCVFWMCFYKILHVITAMLFGSHQLYHRQNVDIGNF